MRKRILYIVVSLLLFSACSIIFIANSTNKSTAANSTNKSTDKKSVEVNEIENDVPDNIELDGKSEEKLEYEDDEVIITSRERRFNSKAEHDEYIKKLKEEKESRPKTDDNILIEDEQKE